jgi:hypothetical protein
MDVSTRLRGGPCEGDCHHLFRRAKIAFDAGAPKIAQRRVNEGLSAINNCRAYEAQTQALASTDEEIDCENSEDAEGATERPDRDDFKLNQSKIMKVIDSNLGEAGLDGAAPAASGRFAEFLALFGRLLEAEQHRRDPELAAYRLALLIEIGGVGDVVKP